MHTRLVVLQGLESGLWFKKYNLTQIQQLNDHGDERGYL